MSGAELPMQSEEKLTRGTVGAMNDEAPAQAIGLGADFCTVALDAGHIVRTPGFRASGRDGSGPLWLHEFDSTRIGKSFLGRIDDLHDVAGSAGRRKLGDHLVYAGNWAPQVGEHDGLREWRR